MERRLSAILAADVAGYGRLVAADEQGTLDRFSDLRREIIGPLVAEHDGRIVKVMGDGFLIEFASAVQAVSCALQWQTRLAGHEAALAPEFRIRFRIGVHVGEIVADAGDIHGHGVNLASRLEPLSDPGGVLISEDAWRQVRTGPSEQFEDAGARALKNIAEPVRVYRWTPGIAEQAAPVAAETEIRAKPAVAVLPLIDLTGTPEFAQLAGGLTEDLATELARFVDFETVAPSLAAEASASGRAQYRVEGSVQLRGPRVRVGAKLVSGDTGRSLWAERYDIDRADAMDQLDDLTRRIVGALSARISHEAIVETVTRRRNEVNAYDLTLRAWSLQRRFDPACAAEVRELAEQACEMAPDYAPAVRLMAWVNMIEATCLFREDVEQGFETAYALARMAVPLDPRAPTSHITLGMMQVAVGLYDRALASMHKAVAMNPNSADGHAYLGNTLVLCGSLDEGLAALEEASRLNPEGPSWYRFFHGRALFLAGALPGAEEMLSETLVATPAYAIPRAVLAAVLVEAGRMEEARAEVAEIVRTNTGYRLSLVPASMPLRRAEHLDRLVTALRAAGLPA